MLLSGSVLAQAAQKMFDYAIYLPQYEGVKSGGVVSCFVAYSENEILCPWWHSLDAAVLMNAFAVSCYQGEVKPGGIIVYSSEVASPAKIKREDVTVVDVPMRTIANEIGSIKSANLVILGAFMKVLGTIDSSKAEEALDAILVRERREAYREVNMKALLEGFKFEATA